MSWSKGNYLSDSAKQNLGPRYKEPNLFPYLNKILQNSDSLYHILTKERGNMHHFVMYVQFTNKIQNKDTYL